jgi:hypothetical protein
VLGFLAKASSTLSFRVFAMGFLRWLFVEVKSIEFAFKVGVLVLRVFERSRGTVCSVFLGKVTVSWLLATLEALQQAEV